MGHWEQDCNRKEHGLSREEAKAEHKSMWKKGKGKGKEKKDETTASVSAVILEVKDMSPGSTNNVPTPSASQTICFYIASDQKWILDSGCTDHITSMTLLHIAHCPNRKKHGLLMESLTQLMLA